MDVSPIHPNGDVASGHPTRDQSNPVIPQVRRNSTDSVRPSVPPVRRLDADVVVPSDPPVRRSARVKVYWYISLSERVLETGCVKCSVHPAMFIHFSTNHDKKKLEGIVLSHVDDLLHGGSSRFQRDVMETVKSSFTFAQEESEQFHYIGMNMIQDNEGVVVNQYHYVQLPDMNIAKDLKCDDILCCDGQAEFRSCVAKILYVGFQSRPDVCFEVKH